MVATGAVFSNYVTGLVVGRGSGTETDPFFFVNSPTPVLTELTDSPGRGQRRGADRQAIVDGDVAPDDELEALRSQRDRGRSAAGHDGAAVIWDFVFSGLTMDDQVRYNIGFYSINDWRYRAPVSGEFRMLGVPQSGRTFLASLSLTL